MIEIYIDNKLVDLGDKSIVLQKEFTDEVENIPTEVEYSYTISLPTTMNNKEIFSFADTFDVSEKFKRLYNAELYVDGVLILNGKFKMTSIERDSYKGNIYSPKRQTISEILGDKNMSEIAPHMKPMNNLADFSNTNTNICNLATIGDKYELWKLQWKDTPSVFDNHVVYPYMLYSLPPHVLEETPIDQSIYEQNLQYGKHNINEDNVFPAFNVVSVLKDMFKSEGYNLVGNVIDGNMKDFFNGLYQTFQYSYDDYRKDKEAPFHFAIGGFYRNCVLGEDYKTYNPSPTLEMMTLFDSDTWTWQQGDDGAEGGGSFKYGVDNPWTCGGADFYHAFNQIYSMVNDKKMWTPASTDKNSGILVVPRSGWYKVNLNANLLYPSLGSEVFTGIDRLTIIAPIGRPNGDIMIGGTTDAADNTTLDEQPFEVHIKKGMPKDNPRFYSFNSFTPMNAVEYKEDYTTIMDEGGDTWIKIPDGEAQRRYAKNGGAAIVKSIGDYSDNNFIVGARFGGAWFSTQWSPAYYGEAQRKNRAFGQGAGLALPDVTKPIRVKHFEHEGIEHPYKADSDKKFDGYYMQLGTRDNNSDYEYAGRTAQCLVRNDSEAYSNFEGYNTLVGSEGSYHWDTTSNYGAVSWEGGENSSASTSTILDGIHNEGTCNANTVVWLNEGETIYMEVLIPVHNGGKWVEPDCGSHSEWTQQFDWVNRVEFNYIFKMTFINGNKDWKPRVGDGIPTDDELVLDKLTNVNKFLPNSLKCNDYLEKFLKTFNLQLTMKDSKTFSIDTISSQFTLGNVIDIDGLCSIDEAEFKPLKSEAIREYKWKIDQNETGYVQGNQSPYKPSHSDSYSGSSWYDSGYTADEQIVNDANSSGSLKKTEAPWSYSWYKTIHFTNGYFPYPICEEYADINVISDTDLWTDGMTYAVGGKETPKTSKNMRLFMLKKNPRQNDKSYSYIAFKYDETSPYSNVGHREEGVWTYLKEDYICNLVLPANFYETIGIDGSVSRIYLDYKLMGGNFDGKTYNQSLTDVFFNSRINGGYDIEVPIKLTNDMYADTKQGTLYKFGDGLYRVKSIEGHDVSKNEDSTLTLTTLK